MTEVAEPPLSSSREEALIERVKAGETQLFLELIKPYEKGVYLLACSVLKNEADAEETA
jgi:RNA polymerase sigma-70 factor (ECF subfamily)